MVEDADGVMDLIDKTAAGFGQTDAACIAVEKDDAKVVLQCLDPRAYARLAGAERPSRAMEAEILCNGKGLNQSDHRNTTARQ
ncbi:hypothetical protein SPYCW_0750 [Sphingopyxis sp. EG6]|nr:hypothetical protein SPYCW_0750 [Sphingopyxis sp. EG6]